MGSQGHVIFLLVFARAVWLVLPSFVFAHKLCSLTQVSHVGTQGGEGRQQSCWLLPMCVAAEWAAERSFSHWGSEATAVLGVG